ncbi:P-loop containing nucleoside triphosphate hydrolase protein [Aspergillus homomorphus CBS 101889]|uniref:P-loop containing nucleoside triphosphate hydrolase protein n=1 Tax=Aspergillus homomorphus (strain CBS 101889) TaxID=1450537 RepID=A0A395I0J1_ASPHC|nr:P-loop containing nucleoside triphosphate hydrolase protein [Aspergillus homomorphus CBS 101889]RAL13245.1 P-loop containing nucleoside triphosphate hydrolase protein [Aspergillus homomorphus CBS 101889]
MASLVVDALGLGLISCCSVPALLTIINRFREPKVGTGSDSPDTAETPVFGLSSYEDEDGNATPESLDTFSASWQRVAIVVLSVLGFGVALSQAIISTESDRREYVIPVWLQMGAWMVQCLQSTSFFIEPAPVKRYILGMYASGASTIAMLMPCADLVLAWQSGKDENTSLMLSQIGIASLRGLFCISIPRRPNVYHQGQVVDQEHTVSMVRRITFSWVNDLLRFVARNKALELDDLPKLPSTARAQTLHARLEKTRGSGELWKALILGHIQPLILQSLLSIIQCLLGFGPQVALFGILKSLENRFASSGDASPTWVWVTGLGVVLVLSSSIESWLWWIIYSQLWIPIYEGISALVFAKSMRCKDVKQLKHHNPEDEHEDNDEIEESEQQGSRQTVINLATVDSKRIADFVMYNYLIPSCILRLVIASAFLVHLIGWRSLLAGGVAALLVTPMNTHLTKKYSAAQQDFMNASDKRMSAVAEVLHGIRQIKFSALEQQWQNRVSEKRRIELMHLWKTSLYTTGMVSVWIMGPLLLSAVSLTVYALTHGELSASVAFTALSVFGSLESALASLPDLMSKGMEAKISACRIDQYLNSAEKAPFTSNVKEITFDNATIAWPAQDDEDEELEWDYEERFCLRNLNLRFPAKGLSVIAGKTGSGKSLLLASILGECDVLAGKVSIPHSPSSEERFDERATRHNWIIDTAVAYVAQNPWMENATIKDNILFGLPYDRYRYRKVLRAVALQKDIDILPDGDYTDIGANGINLSGGQRWRISFARALYSRAGTLIMDDIFSALDAETGRHLYERALTGELGQNRTRILVTHHVGLCLPRTDYCVLLADGVMIHAGTKEDLTATQNLVDFLDQRAETTVSEPPSEVQAPRVSSKRVSINSRKSTNSRLSTATSIHTLRRFTEEEKREKGAVSTKVYIAYLSKGNCLRLWTLVFLAYSAFMALLVGRSWWVSVWTSASTQTSSSARYTRAFDQEKNQMWAFNADEDLTFYLTVYICFSVAACVVGTVRTLALAFASLESSRHLFDGLLYTVLRSPLRWLDTVPTGRILNRFTSDINILDWRLGYDIGHFIYKVLELVGILAAGLLVSPLLLVFACILLALCFHLSKIYLMGMREVKRLESISKSPVLERFSSTLVGLGTIRAFSKTEVYIKDMYARIDRHAQTAWYLWLLDRWLGIRMSIAGALLSTITAALVVYIPHITPALAGFAMSFALQYNYAVAMGLRFYANVETDMNSTERVLEYSSIDMEDQGGVEPPAAWPTRGRVEVEDLVVGYAPDLPPVLSGLNFSLEPNQRLGVVGRTGAGKSSLTLALFRFLEARRGRIYVDGLDISRIKLHALRSRLAIIPQDPVLFSGTLRSNLDPFHEHTDLELYNALERVHLVSFEDTLTLASHSSHDPLSDSGTLPSSSASSTTDPVKTTNFFASLSSMVSEGGLNLSQGQRQLLCLARAIVSQPKIMVLDEATSAVDMETETLIQRSIREEFGRDATSLLVIAHRLSTVADFDKILVLDAGKAAEFGTPQELMAIEGGVFRNLVQNSGEKALLEEMILGKQRN